MPVIGKTNHYGHVFLIDQNMLSEHCYVVQYPLGHCLFSDQPPAKKYEQFTYTFTHT